MYYCFDLQTGELLDWFWDAEDAYRWCRDHAGTWTTDDLDEMTEYERWQVVEMKNAYSDAEGD